jgi:hypothetical protein
MAGPRRRSRARAKSREKARNAYAAYLHWEDATVWARTAAGSLKAVFESSDVERFAWVLMEV